MHDHLTPYGWNPRLAAQLTPADSLAHVARVIQEHKEAYLVHSAAGEIWAEITGKMRHTSAVRSDFPAVGDWVLLRGLEHTIEPSSPNNQKSKIGGGKNQKSDAGPVHIRRILPRTTTIARRLDTGHEQLLAVNADIAFLGASLNENFNPRRLERYVALALDAGVKPVILLTKSDLCPNPAPYLEQTQQIAAGCDTLCISALTGQNLDAVRAYLAPGITAVILGSSGVGKSTLVNLLVNADVQDMMQTREFDDKGRHCTTFRNLLRTPTGGLIIDTPGLRGLSLGEARDALNATFNDIEQLAAACKFTNCTHTAEPHCAIRAALEKQTLNPERLDGYLKMRRESAALAHRDNRIAERKQKKLQKRQSAEKQSKSQKNWNR